MTRSNPGEVTRILAAISDGDPHASNTLLPLVYDELRRLASARMAQEAPGQTLQPTALVHEAYLRLIGEGEVDWQNRRHFFGAAALAMRRILVERARRRGRIKHGADDSVFHSMTSRSRLTRNSSTSWSSMRPVVAWKGRTSA